MGGKTTTSTNTVTIPKEVMDRYNAINTKAEGISNNPFQKYGTDASDFVAQMNEQQQKGISGLNAIASSGPSYNTVQNYLNPYLTNVADTTRKQMEQANEQAQSGALGTAAQSGAFGGDRAGVAAANLANQQNMAMGSTMANIYSQGFDQATNANMNDLNRMAGLAGNQLAMGTQMQQTEQAGKDALINQFQQEQGYPFQVASWLANIALGTGAQSGSTTTAVQPASFWSDRRLKHDIKEIGTSHDGMPIYTFKYKGDPQAQTHVGFMADEVEKKHPEAVGLDPSGYKTVNYDKATESMGGGVHPHHRGEAFASGGVAGPYGSPVGSQPGSAGYVPEGYLPVGDVMVADPNFLSQQQQGLADMLSAAAGAGKDLSQLSDTFGKNGKFYKIFDSKKAYGGGVDGGLIPAPIVAQGVAPQQHRGYLDSIIANQEASKKQPTPPQSAGGNGQQQSGLSDVASTLGSIATIASLFSDRRLKHDIKEIGKTHNGLPIYTFKYKGDDAQQTHVGFMADEVERKHPDAVGQSQGYKTVDYSQAHKFASGGVAGGRDGYQTAGAVDDKPWWQRAADVASGVASSPTTPLIGPIMNNAGRVFDSYALEEKNAREDAARNKDRTWPEYLSSFDLGPRAAATSAMLGSGVASLGANALGLGAGLVGAPETGNALMKFGDTAYQNMLDAETAARGSDREISDMYKRLAGVTPQSSAAPISDFRGQSPVAIAEQKAREAEALARSRALDAAAVGAGTNYTAATQTPLSLADVAGPRFDRTGAIGLGLPPSAMNARPGDYQAEAMKQSLIPRPRMRPADLGTAVAPEVSPTGVVAPLAAGVVAPPAAGRKIASVIGGGNGFTDVMYTDGTKERKQGDLNFRNNNPGNMEYGDLAKRYGAVGTDGRFAVFPDYETGRKAQEALLFESGVYGGMDIGRAISKYAPKGDGTNDPERYASNVAAALGVPVNTPLSDLTPQQRSAMLTAMEKQEGGSGGPATYSTTPIGADGNPIPAQGGVAGNTMVSTRGGSPDGGLKPYDDRNWLGKIMRNPDGSMNKDAMLSLFAGVGDMLSNPSPFLLPTIGAGVSGAANTYMARQGQLANIAQTQAETNRTNIIAASERFFEVAGQPMVTLPSGQPVSYWDLMDNPELQAQFAPGQIQAITQLAKEKGYTKSQEPADLGIAVNQGIMDQSIAQDREAVKRPGGMEALKENPVLLSDLSGKSVDASGQKPNSIEMFDVVSQGAADGNFGFGGNFYANNISPVISRSAQLFGIPMNEDGSLPAEAKAQILGKLSTVNANSTIDEQRAASVFKAWMDVSPNLDMNENAAAAIASTLLMSNQDAIDEAKYVRKYVNSDTMSLASSGRTAYNQTYGALRQTEKDNLSNLIKMSGDESVRTFMEEARKGVISKEEAQQVLSAILGESASPLLYRYFVME